MNERIRFERYRLMVISSWPDSRVKRAALASVDAAIQREMPFAVFPEGLDALRDHERV
jgi:hypothetical protein